LSEILLEKGKGFLSPRFLAPPEEGTSEKRRDKENRSGESAKNNKNKNYHNLWGKWLCGTEGPCNHLPKKDKNSDRK